MKKLICFFLVFIVFILNADPPYQYFYAFGENNEILINWNYVGDEPDLLGCNLLRSEDYISFNQINDELITSNDDTFIYIDEDGIIDTTIYYYKINYIFPDSIIPSLIIGALKEITFGTYSEESVDYPDFAHKVSKDVALGKCERGILICGTGIGMSITANRMKGIRATLCEDEERAKLARAHNDSNVLVLSGRFTPPQRAKKIVDVWLATEFEGGRHSRRLEKIDNVEVFPT